MKKIFKNPLFTFILGAIIFGGISTTFAYSLIANNVEFIPTDNNFDVDNVSDALDNIRTVTTDYVYGEEYSAKYSTWQYIELGFQPRMVIGIIPTSGGFLRTFVYIKDKALTVSSRGSALYTNEGSYTIEPYEKGFRWFVHDSSWGGQTFKYYAFK